MFILLRDVVTDLLEQPEIFARAFRSIPSRNNLAAKQKNRPPCMGAGSLSGESVDQEQLEGDEQVGRPWPPSGEIIGVRTGQCHITHDQQTVKLALSG